MSRRMLQRGRYPKTPGVNQTVNTNSQFLPGAPVSQPLQPGLNYYDPSMQPQPEPNSWNQHSYPNAAPSVPPPSQSNYWPEPEILPNSSQVPWNEMWNSKPDTNTNSSGFTNYQQPPVTQPVQPWQQVPYIPVDNQGYSQQHIGNYHPQPQQDFQHQSTNNTTDYPLATGYQLENNIPPYQSTSNIAEYQSESHDVNSQSNNNSSIISQPPLQNWENGTVGVTQPEELPWTYSAPQYSNPPQTDVSQNSIPSTTASWHPSINSSNNVNSDCNTHNTFPPNYLPLTSGNSEVSGGEPQNTLQQLEQKDLESSDSNHKASALEGQEEVCDADYASSTLSAFFQPSDLLKPDKDCSDQSGESVPSVELSSQEVRTSPSPVIECNVSHHTSRAVSEEGSTVSTRSDFVQEESLDDLDADERSFSHSTSPGLVEEPVNQEVPEPCRSNLSNLPLQTNKESDESGEEPPNQQVPVNSGQSSRSTSAERERLVIRPREDSPFKPPRSSNTKSIVVQQEVTEVVNPPEPKVPEESTVVQEVNLETFPDNLERPSDYEELRKQSPLYASHKHLRQDLNSSPSSLLCDNLDIPCVTLAPAAPPISSARSDRSESSTDSKSERLSLRSSDLSQSRPQELITIKSEYMKEHVGKLEMCEKPKNDKLSSSTNSIESNCEKPSNKSSISHSNNSSTSHRSRGDDLYHTESRDRPSPVFLKDSKINGKAPNNERLQEPLQKPVSYAYDETSSMTNSPRRDDSSYSNRRPDPRDPRHDNRLDNRQRFTEPKYYSYDDRPYYSDKESSRPSSRNSLRDPREEYPYQPRHDNYPYQPNRNDPRQQEYPRPSSRVSESELSRVNKSGQYEGYYRQQYPYPPNQYPPRDNRDASYYQRPQQKGYDYDPYQRDYYASYYDAYQRYAYNNFNYGFYDELYRNDPSYRQYREAQEQYRQYYAKHGYDEYERTSVHSGRSSANELSKDLGSSQYPEQDVDSNESEFSAYNVQQGYSYSDGQNDISTAEADLTSTPSSRLTPVKFSYAHPIARFSPGGLLLTAIPSHVSTSTAMPIRIHNMQEIREGEESFEELKNYQGPLIRGLTHKNDVIEFCTQKIKTTKAKEDVVDRDSYILLWELMILLLRQNGSVAGSDIAELLLKDHEILTHSPADVNDSSSQSHAGDTSSPDEGIVVLHDKAILNNSRSVDVDKITRKFREFLLFGHKKDALEWAMKHGLWGHALFLASKMDLRTYANVMTRFANSLALNDPLQTLYQLMSGRQPLAVTNVADKKWGDWRPHLAMILSNPSTHPEVDSRSITTLGDTLAGKGWLCAAHFCYIMAQVEFGTFEQKNSKLVLLASDHLLPFEEFASNEAIQCTEIYEYAQSLANPSFMLTHLQFYKFLYAMRLVEHGFLEEALHYCEIIAGKLQEHPHSFQYDFINEIFKLATQLKYHDPHFLRGQGEYEDQDDPDWLKNLSSLLQNFNKISTPPDNYSNSYIEPQGEINQNFNADLQQFPTPSVENTYPQNIANSSIQSDTSSSHNQVSFYQTNNWGQQNSNFSNTTFPTNSMADNSGYYNQSGTVSNQSSFHRENSIPSHEDNETTDVPSSPVTQTPPFDYYPGGTQQVQESKPLYDTSNYSNSSMARERRDSALSSGSRYSSGSMATMNKNIVKEVKKPETKKEKPTTQAGKTWLGGIFNMLLPKGPNQMILPDDKNPTIVWDDVNNCWVNKDSNDEDENSAPLAPPTDSELQGSKSSETTTFHSPSSSSVPPMSSSASSNSLPPPVSGSQPVNKFQRPKTRGMRQNYVDVLSNSGATKKTNVMPEGLFTPSYDNTAAPNMFMPQPVSGPVPSDNPSSLEPNHQTYNSPHIETEEPQTGNQATPLMFNPAEFDSRRSNVNNQQQQRQTIGRLGRRTYPT